MSKIKDKQIEALTDEEALNLFIKLLETKVAIETAFVPDEDTGYIGHQILQVTAGEYVTYSQPQPLGVVLTPAPAAAQGATVN